MLVVYKRMKELLSVLFYLISKQIYGRVISDAHYINQALRVKLFSWQQREFSSEEWKDVDLIDGEQSATTCTSLNPVAIKGLNPE